jgi:hypothetical protein
LNIGNELIIFTHFIIKTFKIDLERGAKLRVLSYNQKEFGLFYLVFKGLSCFERLFNIVYRYVEVNKKIIHFIFKPNNFKIVK